MSLLARTKAIVALQKLRAKLRALSLDQLLAVREVVEMEIKNKRKNKPNA